MRPVGTRAPSHMTYSERNGIVQIMSNHQVRSNHVTGALLSAFEKQSARPRQSPPGKLSPTSYAAPAKSGMTDEFSKCWDWRLAGDVQNSTGSYCYF